MAKRNRDTNYTFAREEDFKGSIFRTSVKQSNESSQGGAKDKKLHRYKRVTTREFAKIKGQSPAPEQGGGRKETLPLSVFLRRHLHLQSR